ncbi:glycosyltransferase [Segatella bryantii]|uniref:Glycosyltransferase 2-like domain-containing protein n=1 Tax=Segatella bryantii TaxID=77095 RepID=A0ABX4ELF5_SEGBR|nr:glycosyltransferase [Segatella bryantii]OYP57160.1 hypothetical protein CIK91_00995 [Segatella bryantii]UKK82269.1 glycosyltransferase [Segatella bryantii]
MIAGIVLFNPDPIRLRENIEAIKPQVDKLILIENGSTDFSYIDNIDFSDLVYIRNPRSMGIAYALNQILQYAYDNNHQWALTLDQDSVVADNLIVEYEKVINTPNTGIICCKTIDRNFKDDELNTYGVKEVNYCITSASYTNVSAWKDVGGFDTQMIIDWVDWDICIALRKKGFKILKTDKTYILHELGTNTQKKSFLGHTFLILNRSQFRYYYVARNWIYIGRKWQEESIFKCIVQVLKWLFIALIFEKNKMENLKAFIKGSFDGLKMKIVYDSLTK